MSVAVPCQQRRAAVPLPQHSQPNSFMDPVSPASGLHAVLTAIMGEISHGQRPAAPQQRQPPRDVLWRHAAVSTAAAAGAAAVWRLPVRRSAGPRPVSAARRVVSRAGPDTRRLVGSMPCAPPSRPPGMTTHVRRVRPRRGARLGRRRRAARRGPAARARRRQPGRGPAQGRAPGLRAGGGGRR